MMIIEKNADNFKKITPGEIIAYWNNDEDFKSYAIFSKNSAPDFGNDTYSFIALNTTPSQDTGSDAHYGNIMNINERSSEKNALQWLKNLADHVESVPFYGTVGFPNN